MFYLILIFLIALFVGAIFLIISLKKSKTVDNIANNLFSPVTETVENVMTNIESGKDKLVQTTKDNLSSIKDKVFENDKINNFLNKGD